MAPVWIAVSVLAIGALAWLAWELSRARQSIDAVRGSTLGRVLL